jgi:ABC-2 type transport system ATP-binding protein
MKNIVEIKNLEKHFGDVTAVDGISLNVREGEIYGLLGPNGAGKSTTINILCGLLHKDKGDINVFGKEHKKNLQVIKKDIGIVPQEIAIYEDLKAKENVQFFASLYGLKGRALTESVEEALRFVGLEDRMKEYPKNFSGGMKRRLNIACAIAHKPKLIIMDEPTVGIDPQSRNHILNSVQTLNRKGSTVIYTTHYMEEVESIATMVGIIDHGRLIAEGTCDELQNLVSDHKTIVIETTVVEDKHIDHITNIKGVREVSQEENRLTIDCMKDSNCVGEISCYLGDQNYNIKNISMEGVNLETTFLSLTGRSLRD